MIKKEDEINREKQKRKIGRWEENKGRTERGIKSKLKKKKVEKCEKHTTHTNTNSNTYREKETERETERERDRDRGERAYEKER